MSKKVFVYQEAHFRVLRLLEVNPEIRQREIALAVGVSLGKANYCINALLDKGLIKIKNFKSNKHKMVYAYILTPAGIAEKAKLTQKFLKRKMEEYETLEAEIELLKQETKIDLSRINMNVYSQHEN
jgi:EPS-associated MarR family transcriptional regulator